MNIIFDHREQIAPCIYTFYFRSEKPVQYVAGQYAEFYLPHGGHDARGEHRWFTLSSMPDEPLLAMTTKFAQSDGSSFKRQLRALKPGAQLGMTEPMGDFVLPKDPRVPVVFVVGGIGITPVRSMIAWLHARGESRPLQLVYAARRPKDLVFTNLFEAYGLHASPILTNPDGDWQGHTGHLNARHLLEVTGDSKGKLFYFSGPEPMVEALVAELKQHSVEPYQIVLDYFPGYSQL
ncbi:MAG TPA: FAD-dependent oxidoreductase [Candidatus Saccharimonadales bacterium]|nr:FAD-dependent oxidoreductase [Candidatus Saccharimonadales bacterium]